MCRNGEESYFVQNVEMVKGKYRKRFCKDQGEKSLWEIISVCEEGVTVSVAFEEGLATFTVRIY